MRWWRWWLKEVLTRERAKRVSFSLCNQYEQISDKVVLLFYRWAKRDSVLIGSNDGGGGGVKRVSRRRVSCTYLLMIITMTTLAVVVVHTETSTLIYYILVFFFKIEIFDFRLHKFGFYTPLSSWVDWQKIEITPWKYHESIERNETIPKRHSTSWYDHYKPRYHTTYQRACIALLYEYLIRV